MRQDGSADGPKGPQRKTKERPSFDPRDGVWIALAALIGVGGGHRLYRAYQARRIVNRLTATEPSIADIRASAAFGRAGIMELFRLLTAGPTEPIDAQRAKPWPNSGDVMNSSPKKRRRSSSADLK
jgi:hypothetical protein